MNRTQTGTLVAGTSSPAPDPVWHAAPAPSPAAERADVGGADAAPAPIRNPAAPRGRPSAWLLAGIMAALAAAVYVGGRWWQHSRTWAGTDNAYVSAHVHTVSPRVPGTIAEVCVEENQEVEAGALLARLDARDLQVRRDQAQALVAQAAAKIQVTRAELLQAQALVQREQARSSRAARDLDRARTLSQGAGAAISRQEFDAFISEADSAAAALAGAESALESARAAVQAAEAQAQGARAGLADAELQLSYAELRAPAAGRIGKKNLEVGNRVQPGQSLLALVQREIWVTANYKETQLARLQPGQFASVRVDAFPGKVFTGRLESLSPASGAQFALLPPDNATGNFTRIVQRVPVKIVLDPASLGACAGRVVPGMSAVVAVKTGTRA